MTDEPLELLMDELGSKLAYRKHSDKVLMAGGGKPCVIEASKFLKIEPSGIPRKVAFVDGGDGIIDESPSYMITINRVYYSIFQGSKRTPAKGNPRTEFFAYVVSSVDSAGGKKMMRYDTRLFGRNGVGSEVLPAEKDLRATVHNAVVLQGQRLSSLPRRFAEWRLAQRVVETELDSGDILVLDGSLQTGFKNESVYAKRLYAAAKSKKVLVCSLAKTSRLITESGDSLLGRIEDISGKVGFDRWYVKVADAGTPDDRGTMLAVKFHPKSRFVFRFEIYKEQFEGMSPGEINSVLDSIAANSQDVAMLGYPYGAIDADRFAQVRLEEQAMYRRRLLAKRSKDPAWQKIEKYSHMLDAHEHLNQVTS